MNFKPSAHILGKGEIRKRASAGKTRRICMAFVCTFMKERKEERKETEGVGAEERARC